MSENKVAFRRIHGRIVPIRIKKAALHDAAKSGGIGLAVGAASAVGAAMAVTQSASIRHSARKAFKIAHRVLQSTAYGKQMMLGMSAAKVAKKANLARNAQRIAASNRVLSRSLFKLRNPILIAGALGATRLFAHSTEKIMEAYGNKETSLADLGVETAVGTAAAAGIGALYYSRLGVPAKHLSAQVLGRLRNLNRPLIDIKHRAGTVKWFR